MAPVLFIVKPSSVHEEGVSRWEREEEEPGPSVLSGLGSRTRLGSCPMHALNSGQVM